MEGLKDGVCPVCGQRDVTLAARRIGLAVVGLGVLLLAGLVVAALVWVFSLL